MDSHSNRTTLGFLKDFMRPRPVPAIHLQLQIRFEPYEGARSVLARRKPRSSVRIPGWFLTR